MCDHPRCENPGQDVWARFPSPLRYCSPECRARHGALRRQQRRRDERLDHVARFQRDLQRKYGLTPEQWHALVIEQSGLCAVGGGQLIGKVCVDHDHTTSIVRGLLCNRCNQGLGYFSDSPDRLRAAAQYLEQAAQSRVSVGEEVSAG